MGIKISPKMSMLETWQIQGQFELPIGWSVANSCGDLNEKKEWLTRTILDTCTNVKDQVGLDMFL